MTKVLLTRDQIEPPKIKVKRLIKMIIMIIKKKKKNKCKNL